MLEPVPKEAILVVDDDPSIRDALTSLLEERGYVVSAAVDGQEALDRLRGSSPPWLIVLDLMMPVMDGFEFRVRQLQDPTLAAIPVVVLSAGDLPRKVAPLGVAAWLPKPVEPATLLEIIERLAYRRPAPDGGA